MTKKQWDSLTRMVGAKFEVDGYGLVSVSIFFCSKSFVPLVKVKYHVETDMDGIQGRVIREEIRVYNRSDLIIDDTHMLRKIYDKYLSIKHEFI